MKALVYNGARDVSVESGERQLMRNNPRRLSAECLQAF